MLHLSLDLERFLAITWAVEMDDLVQTFANTVRDIRVPQTAGSFLSGWATVGLLTRALQHVMGELAGTTYTRNMILF
jgi:hypothetical protein